MVKDAVFLLSMGWMRGEPCRFDEAPDEAGAGGFMESENY